MNRAAGIVCVAALCAGSAFGLFLCLRPEQAIRLQQRFYEKINWRIEPISLSREIRNTRAMGCFLLACTLAAAVYQGLKICTVYRK